MEKQETKRKYLSVDAVCSCKHLRKYHTIVSKRPTKEHPLYLSDGVGSYPIHNRYKGKCRFCKCNSFKQRGN